jgi:general transcription factor 3C polypeptide 3 (transcription factor C subunit 4)
MIVTDTATVYLLHAYDYCQDDPVICLSLAIASIGRAMQRQSDNRHHLIAQVCSLPISLVRNVTLLARQAMAFLSRYRLIRGSSAEGVDEVEFNFGRAFQQLGLF